MPDPKFYRSEARRCRELAANAQDANMAERWRSMAREYEMLAEALDAQSYVARPMPTEAQTQPMQQQQTKKSEE